MRISSEELAAISESAPQLSASRKSRSSIDRQTASLRSSIRKDIDQYMQPWMVLLDEAVRFFIHIERYQFTRGLVQETSPFAFQLSRLRSDVLSIRELIISGQEASSHTIARTFVDGVELAMAMAEDPAFAIAYFNAEDGLAFWKKEIAYGKIYGKVAKFIRRTGGSPQQSDEYIATHKAVKTALSGHVHSASHSAFRSGLVPSISHPGMLQVGGIGGLSAHMPKLCLFVADETHIFAACCINAIVKPNPPLVFAVYRPEKNLQNAVTSAHVLQELLVRHGERLQILAEEFFEDDGHAT